MQKTVKVDETTHSLIAEMSNQTDLSFDMIVKYALVSFRQTKDYAKLVLFNQEPTKVAEQQIKKLKK